MNIDKIDKQILHLLQQNARINNLELAQQVNLSPTPCARRVKRLEQAGVIKKYVTELDPEVLGLTLTVLTSVTMERHTADRFEKFE